MNEFANDYTDFNIAGVSLANPNSSGEIYLSCPVCTSQRKPSHQKEKKLAVNIRKGTWYCQHCGWTGGLTPTSWVKNTAPLEIKRTKPISDNQRILKTLQEERKISQLTLDACNVKAATAYIKDKKSGDGRTVNCVAFIYTNNGLPVMIKYRDSKKNFAIEKNSKIIPYGMDHIKGKNECYIVEGEIDKLSYYEVGIRNVISVPTGAQISQKERKHFEKTGQLIVENHLSLSYFDEVYEDFEEMDTIYVCTDDDAAGVKLRNEIARRFGFERCKYISYNKYEYEIKGEKYKCKDANDVLVHLGKDALLNTINQSEHFPITGIITVNDIWQDVERQYDVGLEKGVSTGIADLDPHFTWKTGHTIVLNGWPGMGKTTFALNLLLLSAKLYNWVWGIYCPENYPVDDLAVTMSEIFIGNTMDKDSKARMKKSELIKAREFIARHFYFLNHPDGYSPEDLRQTTISLIKRKGINGIYKDPWNSLVHNDDKNIDRYTEQELSAENRLAVNYNIVNFIAVHPPTPQGEDRKSPKAPSMFQITGGGVWAKKTYEMLCVHVDKTDYKNTIAEIHVQKVKSHKLVGIPTYDNPVLLKFSRRTQRYRLTNDLDPFKGRTHEEEEMLPF